VFRFATVHEHEYLQNKSGVETVLQLFTWVFVQYTVIQAPVKYTNRGKYA